MIAIALFSFVGVLLSLSIIYVAFRRLVHIDEVEQ